MKKRSLYLFPILIVVALFLSFSINSKYHDSNSSQISSDVGTLSTPATSTPVVATKPDSGIKTSATTLATNTSPSIPILMYHEIGDGPNSLYVPTDKFRDQMKYLYSSGYHTVTMAGAYDMLVNAQIPSKTVVLTFDDGYTSFYTKAWPIMKEFGFTGTVYVCTSFTGKNNYLTWDEMKTLNDAGIEIGSHTKNHVDLKTVSATVLNDEVSGSKKILEENLGVPVTSFCYPIGAYDDKTPPAVKQVGYDSAVTVVYGHATPKNNFFLIPRVRVPGWITHDNFAKSIP